jgi:hypothetical protein
VLIRDVPDEVIAAVDALTSPPPGQDLRSDGPQGRKNGNKNKINFKHSLRGLTGIPALRSGALIEHERTRTEARSSQMQVPSVRDETRGSQKLWPLLNDCARSPGRGKMR